MLPIRVMGMPFHLTIVENDYHLRILDVSHFSWHMLGVRAVYPIEAL